MPDARQSEQGSAGAQSPEHGPAWVRELTRVVASAFCGSGEAAVPSDGKDHESGSSTPMADVEKVRLAREHLFRELAKNRELLDHSRLEKILTSSEYFPRLNELLQSGAQKEVAAVFKKAAEIHNLVLECKKMNFSSMVDTIDHRPVGVIQELKSHHEFGSPTLTEQPTQRLFIRAKGEKNGNYFARLIELWNAFLAATSDALSVLDDSGTFYSEVNAEVKALAELLFTQVVENSRLPFDVRLLSRVLATNDERLWFQVEAKLRPLFGQISPWIEELVTIINQKFITKETGPSEYFYARCEMTYEFPEGIDHEDKAVREGVLGDLVQSVNEELYRLSQNFVGLSSAKIQAGSTLNSICFTMCFKGEEKVESKYGNPSSLSETALMQFIEILQKLDKLLQKYHCAVAVQAIDN